MTQLPRASVVLTDVRTPRGSAAEDAAQAIAIRGGRILATGTPEELSPLIGHGTVTESLGGRTVLPAFTDAHIHLELFARSLDQVDCDTPTMEECIDRLVERAISLAPGSWVLGHGWNDNAWGSAPDPAMLDRALPHHPVYTSAKSLHAGWANAHALRLAGISGATPDPEGGALKRDAAGRPTGVLLESAVRLVTRHIPPPAPADLDRMVDHAQHVLWRFGIAAVHDFDGARLLQSIQRLRSAGRLGLRVLKSIPREDLPHAIALGAASALGDEWIRLGHVKLFADGALGSRTAAMLAPYLGEPGNSGSLLLDEEEILHLGRQAALAGLPLAVHAIGDRATHAVLRALATLERESAHPRLPHRIEHLQLLHPDDIPALQGLRCVASMQPIHATSDMLMADRYWGDRNRYAYAWKTVLDSGMTLAFGSDAPVESPDPVAALHAAVTRRRVDDVPAESGWIPEERLALRDALHAFTVGPAIAAGTSVEQGRLRAGFVADLIVLDGDPFACAPQAIAALHVLATMTGGAWRHREF